MAIDTIVETMVGSSVSPMAQFTVPADLNTTSAVARYELMDQSGIVHASGTASSMVEEPLGADRKNVKAIASFSIPSQLPTYDRAHKWVLLWSLYTGNVAVSSFIETFSIRPPTVHEFGVPDIVECMVNSTRVLAVLPADTGQDTRVTIYRMNTPIFSDVIAASSTPVYEGVIYDHTIPNLDTLGMRPTLDPYTLLWEYTDSVTGEKVSEDGYLYHVTPMVLSAAKELQSMVHRVRNKARMEDIQIDLNVCIHFLKMGRDMFNAMVMPTNIGMTAAQGSVRAYWIACAQVLLLQSQYLVEAERSFTSSGQSVNLDFDITSHYEAMASTKQGWLDTYMPDFKRNITHRGMTGGEGEESSGVSRNVGAAGVALSPVSNLYWTRYPRYRTW